MLEDFPDLVSHIRHITGIAHLQVDRVNPLNGCEVLHYRDRNQDRLVSDFPCPSVLVFSRNVPMTVNCSWLIFTVCPMAACRLPKIRMASLSVSSATCSRNVTSLSSIGRPAADDQVANGRIVLIHAIQPDVADLALNDNLRVALHDGGRRHDAAPQSFSYGLNVRELDIIRLYRSRIFAAGLQTCVNEIRTDPVNETKNEVGVASEIVTTRMTEAFPMMNPKAVRKVLSRLARRASRLPKPTASEIFMRSERSARTWRTRTQAAAPALCSADLLQQADCVLFRRIIHCQGSAHIPFK